MKSFAKIKWGIFLVTLCMVFGCSNEPKSSSITAIEVETVIEDWLKLWSTYDLDLVEDIFWQNENATYFSSEKEGLIKGYEHFIAHHEGFGFVKGGKSAEKSLWLEDINITIHNETAVVEAIWYFGDANAAEKTVQNGPVSFVLVNNEIGKVKIAHTHFANYESWKTVGEKF